MPRKQSVTLPINNVELVKLLRQWGWTHLSTGTNHARFRRGETTISVRRMNVKTNSTYEPVIQAAKVDGVGVEEWLRGPIKEKHEPVELIEMDDLNFFVFTDIHLIQNDEEKKRRYSKIRAKLNSQGLLEQYLDVQSKNLIQLSQSIAKDEDELVKLSELKPNDEGYITLEDALALRNLKLNKRSRTSAELIAALSEHEYNDKSGAATSLLLEDLSSNISVTYLSNLLRKFEEAGLVYRQIKGKRTFKIGLTVPVMLTDKQRTEYLLGGEKVISTEPTIEVPVKILDSGMDPAITALNHELKLAKEQMEIVGNRIEAIKQALSILGEL